MNSELPAREEIPEHFTSEQLIVSQIFLIERADEETVKERIAEIFRLLDPHIHAPLRRFLTYGSTGSWRKPAFI
ncbi:MAG: hypothetical protein RDV48_07100 [Candidatus Eremiobacteraeota bacterium]|nr:hypothetical protein [Candidatus Eremiobacteraeota bacterium]